MAIIDDVLYQVGMVACRVTGGRIEVLLLTSRDTGRWIIPKGNIEGTQSAPDAALQEAFEEAGLEGSVIGSGPLGFYTYFKKLKSGEQRPASVEVFLMRAEQQRKKWPEKRERKMAWLPVADAIARIEEPGVIPLLQRLEEFTTGQIESRAGDKVRDKAGKHKKPA
jgi:8-oxo-dGTP pyrophosphatase MutT (NUDIX family)